jgi:hypothetical protein
MIEIQSDENLITFQDTFHYLTLILYIYKFYRKNMLSKYSVILLY